MELYPPGARGPRVNAQALRALRVAAGMTQMALAELAGISNVHVSRLEAEARTHPSPRITKALAEALGVPMTALLAADHAEPVAVTR